MPDRETLTLIITESPTEVEHDTIHGGIIAFNDLVSSHHRTIRPEGPRPLTITLRDLDERLVGGLLGRTCWNWLEVQDLWLAEPARRQGYGSKLLFAAEDEARQRGCERVHLRTYSFQALEFYQKHGYQVTGRLEDYPPGETFFWLCKELA